MVLRVSSDFVEPGARNHDAGRCDRAFAQRVKTRGIHRMSYCKIVCVDDEQRRVCGITQALGNGLRLRVRACGKRQQHNEKAIEFAQAHKWLQKGDLRTSSVSRTPRVHFVVYKNHKKLSRSARFAETPQLHLVAMPGGARQQLTFFADSVSNGRFHPNGGDYIVFMKDV